MRPSGHAAAEAFFLDTELGQRFCLFHPGDAGAECRGAIIYAHPFAEEMNKSRRMAALQSRALAAAGYAVLQIDLYGCGDSSGDFRDARWHIWKDDLHRAQHWLMMRSEAPISVWGLRLGALLALDFARDARSDLDKIVLWQPVFNGAQYLNQFFRLLLANDMIAGSAQKNGGTHGIRQALLAGEKLEIAGYEMAPELVSAIDQLDSALWAPPACPVYWLENASPANPALSPARKQLADAWMQKGASLWVDLLNGPAFWTAQETVDAPEWIAATINAFQRP
ncbi:hydrolase 2, exosortase A system-associated [Undibacterium sp.]|jgi:exosortase A-associated hydrolase 2|uniref:hydrolase 2, exosortase A system-associated n=1 Tax=Undibacterium sp. TaxID=1914977 RepID=UPI002D0E708D|nr:hydrolase 2, exosortase A system-associated [Undibacterium sp.]HTD04496.1 hydrolase 2, exosortase A system-associated [Undibacterium sp.]